MISTGVKFFIDLHDNKVNQKYGDNLPYSFHLNNVAKVNEEFEDLIPNRFSVPLGTSYTISHLVYLSVYGHDSIEDARLTYNDILNRFGTVVAEIIYLCTEDKGRTRSDRKSDKFYEELKTNNLAVFVKLCDLISNVRYSLLTNSKMFYKYKTEYFEKVKPHLYCDQYKKMFDHLEKIFNVRDDE